MRLAYTLHCLRAFRGGYTPLTLSQFIVHAVRAGYRVAA